MKTLTDTQIADLQLDLNESAGIIETVREHLQDANALYGTDYTQEQLDSVELWAVKIELFRIPEEDRL